MRLPWRDVLAIVQGAAPGSAIYRALSPDGRGWDSLHFLIADLIDAVQANTYLLAAVNSPKGKRPKKPKPYPRPGVKDDSRETKTFGFKPMPIDELIERLGWSDRPEVQRGRQAHSGPGVDRPSSDA